jgi:hypothetical protein
VVVDGQRFAAFAIDHVELDQRPGGRRQREAGNAGGQQQEADADHGGVSGWKAQQENARRPPAGL